VLSKSTHRFFISMGMTTKRYRRLVRAVHQLLAEVSPSDQLKKLNGQHQKVLAEIVKLEKEEDEGKDVGERLMKFRVFLSKLERQRKFYEEAAEDAAKKVAQVTKLLRRVKRRRA